MGKERISLQSYIEQGGDISKIDWSKSRCEYRGKDFMSTVVSFEDFGDVNMNGEYRWYFTFDNGNTHIYNLNCISIEGGYVLRCNYDALKSEKLELVDMLEKAKKAIQNDISRKERDLKRLIKEHSLLGNKHDLTKTQQDRKAFLSNYFLELHRDVEKSKKNLSKILTSQNQ